MLEALVKYKDAVKNHKLLQLSFTTLAEYLWLLRSACQALVCFKEKAILYLAAAVSDFYIPSNEMVHIFYLPMFFSKFKLSKLGKI